MSYRSGLVILAFSVHCTPPPPEPPRPAPPTAPAPPITAAPSTIPTPQPTTPAPPALLFATTAELVPDRKLAALVDDLAKEKTIESSHIGAAGAPSRVYAKFVAVRGAASTAQLEALLRHESPIVRGYVGAHIARSVPGSVARLEPLLDDASAVDTLDGCIGGNAVVRQHLLEALCESELPEAHTVIARRADGPSDPTGEALACLARIDGATAAPIVAKQLTAGASGARLERLLRLAALAPARESCAIAVAIGPSDAARFAAASALGRCDDDAAYARLETLANGTDDKDAKANLLLHTRTPPPRRRELMKDARVVERAVWMLENRLRAMTTPELVALTEWLLEVDERGFQRVLAAVKPHPSATELMRKIAKRTAPAQEWGVRMPAIAYLAKEKDRESIPEFRRSLTAGMESEVIVAIQALGTLGDRQSKPAISALAKSPNEWIAKQAKESLAALAR